MAEGSSQGARSRTRRMGQRALKHKLPKKDAEMAESNKKVLLNAADDRLDEAISNGDLSAVREIFACKDREVSTEYLQAALLKAVHTGKKQLVGLLVSHSVFLKGRCKIGCLALSAAAREGNLDIVKTLIRRGAYVDGKDSSGKTALMTAVENNGCSALITFLLDKGKADVNLQNNDGKTALMLAVEQCDYQTVQILLLGNGEECIKDYKCDEDIKDKNGHTALDLAKLNGSDGLMRVLSECRKQSCSPLTIAAGWNELDLVRRLVEVHPSCVDRLGFGDDALTSAMHGMDGDKNAWDGKIHCSFELIEFLVHAGISVDEHHPCGLTPLMFASWAGSIRIVKLLLAHKASVDFQSFEVSDHIYLKQRTALMVAAQQGQVRIVEVLTEAGAKLDIEDSDGESALRFAVKSNRKACVVALLKKQKVVSADEVEIMDEHSMLDLFLDVKYRWDELFKDSFVLQVLLSKAVQIRSYQLVKSLVEFGADVNFCDPHCHDENCEHTLGIVHSISSALDDIDMLNLLVKMGADINFRSDSGHTALMNAASAGNQTHVCNLLKCNADMYAENSDFSALHIASVKGHVGVVTALLDNGMDVDHLTDNETALWSCLLFQTYHCVETLIKHGANVNFADWYDVTVLMLAIKHNFPNLELIINSGVDVDAQDAKGNTALFYALYTDAPPEDMEEKVSLLLQHGANVNHINLNMQTPLMAAAGLNKSHKKVLKVVLDFQPDLDVQSAKGNTAVHCAVRLGSGVVEKLKILAKKGANLNILNHENRSPLMLAFRSLHTGAVRALMKLGAVVNKHNSQAVRQEWKTVLDYYLGEISQKGSDYYHYFGFIICSEALFWDTCSLCIAKPTNIDIKLLVSIAKDDFRLLRLLMKFGAGPDAYDCSSYRYHAQLNHHTILNLALVCNFRISPMVFAILIQRPKIVALFAQICFYDLEDVKRLQHKAIKEKLRQMFVDQPDNDICTLDDLSVCPEKWSLRTWSKLAVLRAVGYGEDREQRVKTLPIPQRIQDELLYKNVSVMQVEEEIIYI